MRLRYVVLPLISAILILTAVGCPAQDEADGGKPGQGEEGEVQATATPQEEGDDPRDTPPPVVHGEDIESDAKKYILLIAGAHVTELAVVNTWQGDTPNLKLIPSHKVPANVKALATYGQADNLKRAWRALYDKYSSPEFKDWTLVAIQPFSQADIDATLDAIKSKNPEKLAVDYVGHGNADSGPFLSLRQNQAMKFPLISPSGKKVTVSIDRPFTQEKKYYVKVLSAKLKQDFANKPVTLVVDGCTLGSSLSFAGGTLHIVVSEESATVCNLALFSIYYANRVTPEAYDDFGAAMPGVISNVNKDLEDFLKPQRTSQEAGYR